MSDADRSNPEVSEPGLKRLAICEIVSLACTLLLGLWAIPALSTDHRLLPIPIAAAFLFIFLSQRIHGETARESGWRLDNFISAVRMLALPMLGGVLLLVGVGWMTGSLRIAMPSDRRALLWLPFAGVAWGLVQQFALQAFVNRRAQMAWGKRAVSCIVVATMFALFHLPNIWLSAATFVGGLVWAVVYQKHPNLWALGLSHAVMTFVLISTVPEKRSAGSASRL